jgi:hypothetical protein
MHSSNRASNINGEGKPGNRVSITDAEEALEYMKKAFPCSAATSAPLGMPMQPFLLLAAT